jgi:hypothetical protein
MNLQNLDWALWRSFLAILRESSLSGAARALDVAHPTVRRHLDELEARLGAPLFVRSPSGLVATELALSLREGAQTMESAAALLVRTASADAGAAAGAVRIAASEIIGVEVLPPILSALKARHPGLSFELTLSNSTEDVLRHILRMLSAGRNARRFFTSRKPTRERLDPGGLVIYITEPARANFFTGMFWAGEKQRAPAPTDNIHKKPPRGPADQVS